MDQEQARKAGTMKQWPFFILLVALVLGLSAWTDTPTQSWSGPDLGGQWLYDEQAGEWWYLHSIEEFDAPVERCNECHENAYSSPVRLCSQGLNCKLLVQDEYLLWQCTGPEL